MNDYILATPVTIRKIKIYRLGFSPLTLRYKSDGTWQLLSYTYINGDEGWSTLDKEYVENFLNNLPESDRVEELL